MSTLEVQTVKHHVVVGESAPVAVVKETRIEIATIGSQGPQGIQGPQGPQGIQGPQGPAGSGGGSSDHGALTGLADDDHPHYHNNARGDARYAALSHTHIIANITGLQTALDGKQPLATCLVPLYDG